MKIKSDNKTGCYIQENVTLYELFKVGNYHILVIISNGCFDVFVSLFRPFVYSLLKEFDSVFGGGISLKDGALALVFQYPEGTPQQFFVDTLEGHAVNIFSAV